MKGNEFLNTKFQPLGFKELSKLAFEARAYHHLNPYPFFHFNDWKTETRGPLPRCMPFVKRIVTRGARWLFGRSPQILFPADEKIEKYFNQAWLLNEMPTRMVNAAEDGARDGGVFLMFSYDEADSVKLRFRIYNLVDHCQLFYDPFDRNRLLMARIQFVYFDAISGNWYWHREEWTDDLQVTYKPVLAKSRSKSNPWQLMPQPTGDQWEQDKSSKNPFGLIPGRAIRNRDTGGERGEGDLWDCYRVVDRVNLTYHLMDKSNQFDSEPNKIFIDLEMDQDDVDRPLAPNENMSLSTTKEGSTDKRQGRVEILEAKGNLRPAMMEYAKDLKKQIHDAGGSVESDAEQITNKGNLTTAVMKFIFAPLVEATDEKKKTYGEDGICKFLELCAIGLKNLGAKDFKGLNVDDPDKFDVQLKWPPYFDLTEEEKSMLTQTTQTQVDAGFLTQERAIERVANAEGIQDVNTLKSELPKEPPAKDPAPAGMKFKRGGKFASSSTGDA